MLVSIFVLSAGAWYIMTPAERERVVRAVVSHVPKLKAASRALRRDHDELLDKMLRERTPWPLATPLIALLNLALYTWMQLDPGVSAVEMFGNFGPRTTNGEWWRLVTSMFVHDSAWRLLLNMTALLQVGLLLERLVGSLTFSVVYLVAGVLASLLALSTSQGTPVFGASAAVFGIYGLLMASWMWGACQRADSTIRLRTIKAFAPLAMVFSVVNLAGGGDRSAVECLGLATGFACGVLMARPVRVSKPSTRRVATIAAAGAYLAIVASVPLRGVSDVRPTLAKVLGIEQRTSAAYDAALVEFRAGRLPRQQLAQLIDRQVLPELRIARFDVQALSRPPREHQPLVQAAEIYTLRRMESWKVRSRALRNADWRQLQNADALERAALQRLEPIRSWGGA